MRRALVKPVRACTLRNWCLNFYITFKIPLYTLHLTILHTSYCTLHTALFVFHTPYFSYFILYSLYFTLHTLQSTFYTVLFGF